MTIIGSPGESSKSLKLSALVMRGSVPFTAKAPHPFPYRGLSLLYLPAKSSPLPGTFLGGKSKFFDCVTVRGPLLWGEDKARCHSL